MKAVGVQVTSVNFGRKINQKEFEETPNFPDGSSGNMVRIRRIHTETGLVDVMFSICLCCHNKNTTGWDSVSSIYSSHFRRLEGHGQG